MYNEGIMYKDKVKKSQGEGIANTNVQKLMVRKWK
jgi:hypothetical protein